MKECPPPRFPNPSSRFKDGGGDLAPCAGQMRVMADTGVNIQLKINRLDNYYMLLVPINLIAVSPPPFTRQENTEHSFLWGVLRWILCVAFATN